MRLTTFIILTVFALSALAQKTPLEKAVNKYGDKKGIAMEVIDPSSDEFKEQIKSEDNAVAKSLNQLDFIKILKPDTLESSEAAVDKFLSNVRSALEDDSYASIVEVHAEDGEDVSLHVNQTSDGLFRELALLVEEEDGFTMIYMKGEVDMNAFNFMDFLSVLSGDKKKDCKQDEHEHDHEHDHDEPGGE